MRRRVIIGRVLLLMIGGCEAPTSRPEFGQVADAPELPSSADILWTGCAADNDHLRCEVGQEPLVVWVPGELDGWQWQLDGEHVQPTVVERASGGTRVTLPLASIEGGEHELALVDEAGAVAWTLTLLGDALAPYRAAFASELGALRGSADLDARLRLAQRLLAEAPSEPSLDKLARLQAARELHLDDRGIASSPAAVEDLLERAADTAVRLQRWGEPCKAASIGLMLATNTWNTDGIARWERWVEPCRQRSAHWDIALSYYVGVVRLRQGRYSDAALELGRARRGAAALGLSHELLAQKRQIELLLRTARFSEASRELQALQSHPAEGCARASLDSDIGFFQLLAWQQGDIDLGDPRVALGRALASHDKGGPCERLELADHDRIKLGYAAAEVGDAKGLAHSIGSIDPRTLRGKFPAQYHELRVLEAVLREATNEAHVALEAMESSLSDTLDPAARWRLHTARAQVAEAEGDVNGVIDAQRAAEGVLDEIRDGVSSEAIRDRWLSGYRRSATSLVERLIEAGRLEEAACATRRARSRALEFHDLAARPSSSSATPPHTASDPCLRPWSRRPDELVLLVFARPSGGWWAFEIRDEAVRDVTVLPELPIEPGEDTGAWWDPWSSSLAATSAVRVLPSGEAHAVAFHRLGWRGAPLASQRAVIYGLDLEPMEPTSLEQPPTALVAFADVDPLRSLDRYANAVTEVDATLSDEGWSTEWMEGEQCNSASLRERLPSVSLFHYYGHGEQRGVDPLSSPEHEDDVGTTALVLAGGMHLDVDDVLTLPQVPRWAVLLGCQLGHHDLHGWSGGLSLAHAFLLAGTEQVMASTHVIEAAAVAELGPQLYADRPPDGFELSSALHLAWASRDVAAGEPRWKDLRVWSR